MDRMNCKLDHHHHHHHQVRFVKKREKVRMFQQHLNFTLCHLYTFVCDLHSSASPVYLMSQVGLCCWEQIGLRLDDEQSPYVSSLLFLCAPSVSSSFIPLTFSIQLYLPPHFVFPLSQASMEPCSVKSKWSILVGFKTDSLTTAFVIV